MIYPKKINANKSEKIIRIAMIISLAIAVILTIINKLTTPRVPWAASANSGIIYIWIVARYSVSQNVNIGGHVLIQTIAVSILTLFIDYELGYKGWSLGIAIPIILITANASMLLLNILSYKKNFRYAMYELVVLILSILPVVFITEKMVENPTLSYISLGVSIINLIITMIISFKDIKEAVIRKFHM